MEKGLLNIIESELGYNINNLGLTSAELEMLAAPELLPFIIGGIRAEELRQSLLRANERQQQIEMASGQPLDISMPFLSSRQHAKLKELTDKIEREDRKQRGKKGEIKEEREFKDLPFGEVRPVRPVREETGMRQRPTPQKEEEPDIDEEELTPLLAGTRGRGKAKPQRGRVSRLKEIGAGTAAAGAAAGIIKGIIDTTGRTDILPELPQTAETIKKIPKPLPDPSAKPLPPLKKKLDGAKIPRDNKIKLTPDMIQKIRNRQLTLGTSGPPRGVYKTPKETHNSVELVRRANALYKFNENIFNPRFT